MAYTNVSKNFQWRLNLDGLIAGLAQEVKIPDEYYDEIKHGAGNYDITTHGKWKVEKIMVKKLIPADIADLALYNRFKSANNPSNGGGLPPSELRFNMVFETLDYTGLTVLRSWTGCGCWIQKMSKPTYSLEADGANVHEELTISVDILKAN